MNEIVTNIGWFTAGAIAMLVFLLALGERRHDVPPAEPVILPEPQPVPEPAEAVEPEPAPSPVVAVAPMLVIPPWPTRVGDPDPVPVPVAWRSRLALETAPLCGRLPAHESTWRHDDWKLDDPDRTQMMRIIGGVHADELDVNLGEPQPMPGFEVSPGDRRRLSLSEDLIAEVTASLPSRRAKAEVSA
jgi:hypothetical protein